MANADSRFGDCDVIRVKGKKQLLSFGSKLLHAGRNLHAALTPPLQTYCVIQQALPHCQPTIATLLKTSNSILLENIV